MGVRLGDQNTKKGRYKYMKDRKELNKIRRNNAKLYPIYKMFSWDLLFFYSIEFLFYTITKKLTASEVLIINGFYMFFRIVGQIFAVAIVDFLGKRKSIIIGNILIVFYMLILIFLPGAISVILADLIFALGYDMKTIAEPNLLYDSVSTKGGEGLYSKLDAKGVSWYYILDGIASLTAGYLFVVNNYLPMFICLGFIIISTILSFKFKDIYEVKKEEKKENGLTNTIKEYAHDLRSSFKFILKSKRMKAFILFQIVLYSLITIMDASYHGNLLTDIGIKEEQFSMIFAVLTLIGGISVALKRPIEKNFKNRTLSFLSLLYIGACVITGVVSSIYKNQAIIPLVLIMFAIQQISKSIWYILESKYLNNFTTENMRNKITFTYEFIGGIAASIFSILGGLLLEVLNVENAFLLVGIISLVSIIIVLNYMKTRFGLKPEEYKKEDIEFENV